MPQLEFSWFTSELFWLAATFVVLYLFVAFFAVPKVGSVVEGRKAQIAEDLKKAEISRNMAVEAERQYISAVEKAKAEGADVVNAAIAKANSESIAKGAELDKKLAKKLHDAEMKISEKKNKLMDEMLKYEAEITQLILDKVAGLKLEGEKVVEEINSLSNQKKSV